MSNNSVSTDREIIQRSLDQPQAFAELFDRHAATIGGYAARRVGQDAGEDVLSETFLVAFSRRRAFDAEWETALPWLYGIASRLIRKHRAREAQLLRAAGHAKTREDHVSDGGLDTAGERLDAQSGARILAPRIARLAARDRDTLLLYAWGDLSYEEVAQALGVPVGTVRSRMNRARRLLDPDRVARSQRARQDEGGEIDGQVAARA